MLCVCTANMCRSPMLEVLLDSDLRARGVEAHVHSAGTLADGRGAAEPVIDVLAQRGHDLSGHVSRRLDPDLVAGADLVLGLAREHVREAVVARPESFHRVYTPKELVRRSAAIGGRRAGEPLDDFLARVHEGRTAQELLRPDAVDDVADPIGGSWNDYVRTADELQQLSLAIAGLLAGSPRRPSPAGTR